MEHLAFLLCTVSVYLGETKYIDYYCRDFPEILIELQYNRPSAFDEDSILSRSNPPSVFCWLETSLKNGCKSVSNSNDIPNLMCNSKSLVVGWARKVLSFFSLLLGAERDGAMLSSGVNCEIANGSARSREEIMVLAMVAEKFGRQHLDLLPVGVSLPLRHVSLHSFYSSFLDFQPFIHKIISYQMFYLKKREVKISFFLKEE